MKRITSLFCSFLLFVGMAHSAELSGTYEQKYTLTNSISEKDMAKFDAMLDAGVTPYSIAGPGGFFSSAVCQSTVLGSEEFFERLIERQVDMSHVSKSGWDTTALTCAIFHKNWPVYLRILELGVDPDQILNPNVVDTRLQKTAFSDAIGLNRYEFAWDLLNRSPMDDVEIRDLIRVLERNGGIKGDPVQHYREKLTNWLREQGIKVNPKPAGTLNILE